MSNEDFIKLAKIYIDGSACEGCKFENYATCCDRYEDCAERIKELLNVKSNKQLNMQNGSTNMKEKIQEAYKRLAYVLNAEKVSCNNFFKNLHEVLYILKELTEVEDD